jgi:hypothetical protein
MTDLYDGPTTQLVTTCATCKFWHTLKPGSAICRRNAPQAGPVLAPNPVPPGLTLHMVWPATAASDWCGDHQPRLLA